MFDELRHFLLIVEHGTFTAAARRAHLSQPALTASIRRLEDRFAAKLLHRGAGGAELTAAGRALVPRAHAVLAAVADAQRAVQEIEGLEAGMVSLGAGATACTYILPPLLARYRKLYPGVRFRLREAFTDQIALALEQGDIDLGVISDPAPGATYDHFYDDELIVVASPDLDPDEHGFVTFPEGSATRTILLQHFPDAEMVMELGSIAAVKGNVRAGMGRALVSRAAVGMDLKAGRLIEIEDPRTPIRRQLALIHRGIDRLPPAAGALRELMLATR